MANPTGLASLHHYGHIDQNVRIPRKVKMTQQNYDLAKELGEASAMGENFSDYIRQNELYGNVGGGGFFGGGAMPRLTVGAFQLRLRRLRALEAQLLSSQRADLEKVEMQFDHVRSEWRVHFEKKIVREANSRLDAMREFFRECQESGRLCASAYPAEAQRRTITQEVLYLVEAHGLDDDDLIRKTKDRDGNLRGFVEPAEFLFADILKPVYPEAEFWWLYHAPPEVDR